MVTASFNTRPEWQWKGTVAWPRASAPRPSFIAYVTSKACHRNHYQCERLKIGSDVAGSVALGASNPRPSRASVTRRDALLSLVATILASGSQLGSPGYANAALAGVSCPGLNGYALQQCLRDARKAREAADAASGDTEGGGSSGGGTDDVREERLRYRQYEQPGTLVTLPSGLQYRELLEGGGPEATLGSVCEISYVVYRLSSGAYYKYSSGGTPVFLFSLGYGQEGKDDVGQTYRFRLGEPGSLPAAVTPALLGMRQGGKRRVLVPPSLGWVNDQVGPRPDTFGGQRRLVGHRDEPLLFEAELVRVRQQAPAGQQGQELEEAGALPGGGGGEGSRTPGFFRLPAPPTYYGRGPAQ